MQSGGGVMNVFGNKIKRLREGKNMSIRMLAQEIGMSSGQISKVEKIKMLYKSYTTFILQ